MDCKKKKYKPLEELTIRDNFMFVKVFSDEAIAKPFLKALLKIEIERVSVVGEAHQQADPNKKYIRFDVWSRRSAMELVALSIWRCRWSIPRNCR